MLFRSFDVNTTPLSAYPRGLADNARERQAAAAQGEVSPSGVQASGGVPLLSTCRFLV